MIPVFRPSVGEEELAALREVFASGWLGLGPKTAAFEAAFAQYVGAKYAVGMNSGTAALHLALGLLNLRREDEVLVPTITFVSTAHAAVYNGATPVFVDVCWDTLCMDIEDLKRKVTDKTKAIVPVHYGGHPCDMEEIKRIAEDRGIAVVEDAAHACGATYKGKRIGSISPLTCFSFHAVKNLCCGEGGMVTTDRAVDQKRLQELRWLGISKDTWQRTEESETYAWQYWVNELGFKAHLSDVAAAIGLVQLKKLEASNGKRRRIVARYDEGFKGIDWIETPPEKPYVQSSWHIYHIKVENRDGMIRHLKAHDIAPGVHYYPIHMHPYYARGTERPRFHCPTAEQVWKRMLSLPMFPDMTDDEIDRVIETVLGFEDK